MNRDAQPRQLRLFIAFALPPATLDAVARWQRQEIRGGTGVRLSSPDHLHITVAFLGSQLDTSLGAILDALRARVKGTRRPAFRIHQYRERSRVGMLVLREDVDAGDRYAHRAQELTGRLSLDLEALGVLPREPRTWRPHITVARFRHPPGLRPPLPNLGPISPTEIVLYESLLQPEGSVYRPIEACTIPD